MLMEPYSEYIIQPINPTCFYWLKLKSPSPNKVYTTPIESNDTTSIHSKSLSTPQERVFPTFK